MLKLVLLSHTTLLLFLTVSTNESPSPPQEDNLIKRYEYKYSFKGPHLLLPDNRIPFWQYGGDVIAGSDFVRLTPSLRSKRGWVWTKNASTFDQWSIDVAIRVSGRGRLGADGIAIWYTEELGSEGGLDVFGSKDRWKGLGVFLDSYDNDGAQNNPYVYAINNDGKLSFDHASDGSNQMIGGCQRDFRNKPFPVVVRLTYRAGRLQLALTNGLTTTAVEFEPCFSVDSVSLPKNGFIGVTATTGGLADDHDVMRVDTYSFVEPPSAAGAPGQAEADKAKIDSDQREKFEKEFADYLERMREDEKTFREQHPERNLDDEIDVFEELQDRQMKQIMSAQDYIVKTIRALETRISDLNKKQDYVVSSIASIQQRGSAGGSPDPNAAVAAPGTIMRHEVDALMTFQRDLTTGVQQLRSQMENWLAKTAAGAQASGGGGGGQIPDFQGSQVQGQFHEIRDRLSTMSQHMEQLLVRAKTTDRSGATGCEDVACLGWFFFVVVIGLQTVVFILYSMWRSYQEQQRRKLV